LTNRRFIGRIDLLKLQGAFIFLTLFVPAAFAAELAITSFSQAGRLTWTNSSSKSKYTVEVANSPTGSWVAYRIVLDQTFCNVSTNYLLQQPSRFLRVSTDPSPETNVLLYTAFWGNLTTNRSYITETGTLAFAVFYDNTVLGQWDFHAVADITNLWSGMGGGPRGQGLFTGTLQGSELRLSLGDYLLSGTVNGYPAARGMVYTNIVGTWSTLPGWFSVFGPFTADKSP
jgi:hypothetical protein